jgi:hypothetical protein
MAPYKYRQVKRLLENTDRTAKEIADHLNVSVVQVQQIRAGQAPRWESAPSDEPKWMREHQRRMEEQQERLRRHNRG